MVFDPLVFDGPTIWLLIVGLGATGAIAGILAGLLGVGGGIVIVPVLFWILNALAIVPEHVSHLAVATSLATIIPTSISSMRAHNKRGTVDLDLLKLWGPAIILGAIIGGALAAVISGGGLRYIFGFVGLLVAINMALPKTLVVSQGLPASAWLNRIIATVIGLISSLMGIGGGTLSVPTLSSMSFPVHRAVGTASAMGLMIAVPGVIGFIYAGWGVTGLPWGSFGYVSIPAALMIAPLSYAMAPIGVRLAHALNSKHLKLVFALFLLITSVRMLLS